MQLIVLRECARLVWNAGLRIYVLLRFHEPRIQLPNFERQLHSSKFEANIAYAKYEKSFLAIIADVELVETCCA